MNGGDIRRVELTEAEAEETIAAIQFAQDQYAEAGDSLAQADHDEDRQVGRRLDKRMDVLDSVRRKLGDKWEPLDKVPDTPEGLT